MVEIESRYWRSTKWARLGFAPPASIGCRWSLRAAGSSPPQRFPGGPDGAVGRPGVGQVIDTGRMVVRETVATEEGSKTTAVDTRRRVLYVFRPISCSVAAFRVA